MGPSYDPNTDITELLQRWSEGQDEALRAILPLAYDQLRAMARAVLRGERADHTLQATALVGELYVKLAARQSAVSFQDRAHFFCYCARMMRWILASYARGRQRHYPAAPWFSRQTELPWLGRREADPIDLDRALTKFEADYPRAARVLELRVYLGCTATEVSDLLEVSKPTVDRDLTFARAWFTRELRPGGDEEPARDEAVI